MIMRLLEAEAAVLSVPPVFDERTARDVLEALGAMGRDVKAGDTLRLLRLAGVLEEWQNGFLCVAEPLRQDLRVRLADEAPETFRAAAGRFAEHAANGFGDRQAIALGQRPAAVSAAVLRVMATPPDQADEPLNELVELVAIAPAGRRGDGTAAARQLAALPGRASAVTRAVQFLLAFDEWCDGHRQAGADRFARVIGGPRDRQEAIARHLLGVHAAAQGDNARALDHLRTAVDLLRGLHDRGGLAQTLTTLGRVLRTTTQSNPSDLASQEDWLAQAAAALEESARLGSELGEGDIEGRALAELARLELAQGSLDTAIEVGEHALTLLRRPDDVMEIQLLLGRLFRDAGMDELAGWALDAAAEIAASSSKEDRSLARVLNVQASADRRAGRTDDAIERARRSLAIGEALGDRRHTAHAMHTLAAALLDRGAPGDREEAGRLLVTSSDTLTALGDRRGADMVANTNLRLSRR